MSPKRPKNLIFVPFDGQSCPFSGHSCPFSSLIYPFGQRKEFLSYIQRIQKEKVLIMEKEEIIKEYEKSKKDIEDLLKLDPRQMRYLHELVKK